MKLTRAALAVRTCAVAAAAALVTGAPAGATIFERDVYTNY